MMSEPGKERIRNGSWTSNLHHGQSYRCDRKATGAYQSWTSMKSRCLRPNAHAYELYGGRGITICERWLKFENFFEDMGSRPENTSLDRIDNAKGYYKENCRWADKTTQCANCRPHRDKKHSKYKGVCRNQNGKRFKTYISFKRKRYLLGTFDTELEAFNAYSAMFEKLHGFKPQQ